MTRVLLIAVLALATAAADAQSLYRYKDASGRWQFTDRPPAADEARGRIERDELTAAPVRPTVSLSRRPTDRGVEIVATNTFHCPVQLVFRLQDARNVKAGLVGRHDTVLGADSTTSVLEVEPAGRGETSFSVAFSYLPGDPRAKHAPEQPYRLPFAVGNQVRISQAFPAQITHADPASRHAIDVAVPVGTAIYAARAGVVFEIAYDSYSGGTDEEDVPKANIVRIVHDDGSMAVYAHLAWNSIRVRAGQRVRRGEYIADSGNTGFSSGPHLHFAVQLNDDGKIVSVPVSFLGGTGQAVAPVSGGLLTAY